MVPAASNLLTRDMSDVSVDLSRRLGELSLHTQPLSGPSATNQLVPFSALRHGQQFIVSINLPGDDQLMLAFVEKQISIMLKDILGQQAQ
jgi:hypothetical protein